MQQCDVHLCRTLASYQHSCPWTAERQETEKILLHGKIGILSQAQSTGVDPDLWPQRCVLGVNRAPMVGIKSFSEMGAHVPHVCLTFQLFASCVDISSGKGFIAGSTFSHFSIQVYPI